MARSGFDASAEDVSARAAEPFWALFDNNFQPMLLIDPETSAIVDANPAACNFYGYSRAEFIRLKKADIDTAPESEVKAAITDSLAGRHTRFQFQHQLANGDIQEVEDWMGPVTVGPRQLLCSIVRDVTNQRRAEAALRASQATLATAESIARVGSWDWDIVRNTLIWSDEQCRIFGYTPQTFSEKYESWMVCLHPDDRKRVQEAIDAAVAGRKTYNIDCSIVRSDGATRIIHSRGDVFRDKSGKPIRMVGTCQDITDRRHAEEALRQSQKLESVGQLTGGIAHDFNNLLSVIVGNLELILDRAETDPVLMTHGHAALDGALQGADLIRRLLAFSRKQSLNPKVIDLGERLVQMSALLQRTLGEQIAVEIRAAADLWPVIADPSQIDNSVLNLALNARDAMPKGGTITIDMANVRLDEDYATRNVRAIFGDYVLLAVRDTGTGMPPEVLGRIFEPFFTTKEVGEGSGLGLSMVYGFVKQSNGHIKIESEIGSGTTVTIYLPRANVMAQAELEPEDRAGNPLTNNERILVVEDNEHVRNVVTTRLTDLGYRTLEAESGEAALAILDDHPDIDLMFSGIIMRGGMNGNDLAFEARKRRPDLKILLTSGYEMSAMARGVNDTEKFELLKKPYRKHDLAHKLRQMLMPE